MRSETREELANYLLNHCFVIRNLDSTREKYYLITNNEEELQTIFRPLGYSIVINRTLRVAQLVNLHEWGRVEFQKYETILLLILRLLYVEKRETLSVSEQLVLVTVEEIEAEYTKLNLARKLDRRTFESFTHKKHTYHVILSPSIIDLNELIVLFGFSEEIEDGYFPYMRLDEAEATFPSIYRKWIDKLESLENMPRINRFSRSRWFYAEDAQGTHLNFKDYSAQIKLIDEMNFQ